MADKVLIRRPRAALCLGQSPADARGSPRQMQSSPRWVRRNGAVVTGDEEVLEICCPEDSQLNQPPWNREGFQIPVQLMARTTVQSRESRDKWAIAGFGAAQRMVLHARPLKIQLSSEGRLPVPATASPIVPATASSMWKTRRPCQRAKRQPSLPACTQEHVTAPPASQGHPLCIFYRVTRFERPAPPGRAAGDSGVSHFRTLRKLRGESGRGRRRAFGLPSAKSTDPRSRRLSPPQCPEKTSYWQSVPHF
ncbi:hypothetical protein AAFF_G00307360 [Aldrovandia affinis]|uniref:Uncharacterized protein n=1 Tax=Aldrovandia affinis TaxID=143900 RepID=A0AAD7R7W0_9TELE|nr:hypothetical protein AAFF_G00307360 [Aldrovandia affinis]